MTSAELSTKPTPPVISPTARKLLAALVVSLLTGVGLLENSMAVLVALTTGAAGAVASYVVEWIRLWLYAWATNTSHTGFTLKLAKLVSTALYTKRGIRFTVIAISVALGAAATAIMGILTGQSYNIIIGAAWTYIGSQLAHLAALPTAEQQHDTDYALEITENILQGDIATLSSIIETLSPEELDALRLQLVGISPKADPPVLTPMVE